VSVGAADIFHLGQRLIQMPSEAEKRCGIGRLYYACFQLCDGLRIELGRPLPTDCGSHEAVANSLRAHKTTTPTSEAVALNRIGTRLDSLRTIRHRADYRISDELPAKDVAAAVRLAQMIFSEVATFSAQCSLTECHSAAQV
jgi:hypothetical protein